MLVFKSFQVMHSKANANFENVFIETEEILYDNINELNGKSFNIRIKKLSYDIILKA